MARSTTTAAECSTRTEPATTQVIQITFPRGSLSDLPYSSHPIFSLRRWTLLLDLIGIALCCVALSPFGNEGLTTSAILLGFSALFCTLDLIRYASKKKAHPDPDDPDAPKWPSVKFMTGDVLLAIALQFVFWPAVLELSWYYSYGNRVVAAYGLLVDFICSLLHAYAFWKQLMALKKDSWLASLEHQPCPRCGYSDLEAGSSSTTLPHQHNSANTAGQPPPNTFAYAGPSADFREGNIMTPESPESAMEEGLLIGSDYGAGYGSIKESEPMLEQPEEIVVGKGKKKKQSNSSESDGKGKGGRVDA